MSKFISIHAPTRGATWQNRTITDCGKYFNPRSYKRSDGYQICIRLYYGDFNPRSYKRSDNTITSFYKDIAISIHAPTRGATFTHLAIGYTPRYFNPRSYKRSDLNKCAKGQFITYFNPRSYKRSDVVFIQF